MKKIIALFLAGALAGCSIFSVTSRTDRKKMREQFSVQNDVVLYNQKPFAKLQAITWSLDGGELVKEMNFKLIDDRDLTVIGGMIDFLSDRHQGEEIEVEFEIINGSEQFKL